MGSTTLAISGASGFVGRHLCAMLRALPAPPQLVTPSRAAVDLLAPDTLPGLCHGPDGRPVHAIVHLAALAHVNHVDAQRVQAVNVQGTAQLLQAAIDAGVPHLIYLSSVLADAALERPRTTYGEAKWQAEQLLQQAHASGAIAVTILRPANVYGVGMKGNLRSLIRLIDARLLPPLPDFRQPLSLLSAEDLCQAIWLAARQAPPATGSAPVLTLSDGQRYTLRTLECAIREALGRSQPRWALPAPLLWLAAVAAEGGSRLLRLQNGPGLRHWHTLTRAHSVDITAAQQHLGYNPQHSFQAALPALLGDIRRSSQ